MGRPPVRIGTVAQTTVCATGRQVPENRHLHVADKCCIINLLCNSFAQPMKIGYARVSTGEQDTAAQSAALKAAGCDLIFREKASGGRWDRPELHKLLT